MYRRVLIAESVIASVIVLAVLGWAFWRNLPPAIEDPTAKAFARIQEGMTLEDVKAILGDRYDWNDGYVAGVDLEDGTSIKFDPPTALCQWDGTGFVDQVGFDEEGRVFWKRHLVPPDMQNPRGPFDGIRAWFGF